VRHILWAQLSCLQALSTIYFLANFRFADKRVPRARKEKLLSSAQLLD